MRGKQRHHIPHQTMSRLILWLEIVIVVEVPLFALHRKPVPFDLYRPVFVALFAAPFAA